MKEPDELDPLLEDQPTDAPPDLAERVVRGLQPELRDVRLDRLLDRLEVDEPPAEWARELARRLRPAVEAARHELRPGPPRSVRRMRPRAPLLLAAAALLAALLVTLRFVAGAFGGPVPGSAGPSPGGAIEIAEADLELLESLDLLENWEILTDDELDLLLVELDEVDLTLFEAANELDIPWDDVSWDEG